MNIFIVLLSCFSAYLVGSLSFAIVFSRCFRLQDPRHYGSGNPGATNVLRSGHRVAALLTLLMDALKGAIPVLLAMAYLPDPTWAASVGLSAFIGHLFPVFFRFQGGKGVATAAGVVLALSWPVGLLTLGVFVLLLVLTRYVSLASMLSAFLAPVFLQWMPLDMPMYIVDAWSVALWSMALLLALRHQANILRLLQGNENKIF